MASRRAIAILVVLLSALLACGLCWPESDIGAVARFVSLWIIMPILFVIIPGVLIVAGSTSARRWVKNERLNRRRRRGQCLVCGYDRRGIPEGAPCPECGSVCRGGG
jgi:hypothetical protein